MPTSHTFAGGEPRLDTRFRLTLCQLTLYRHKLQVDGDCAQHGSIALPNAQSQDSMMPSQRFPWLAAKADKQARQCSAGQRVKAYLGLLGQT